MTTRVACALALAWLSSQAAALAQEGAFAQLSYVCNHSATGPKDLTIDARGAVIARFRGEQPAWLEEPRHPRAGEAVQGQLTAAERRGLERALAGAGLRSVRVERDSYVPGDAYVRLRWARPLPGGATDVVEVSGGLMRPEGAVLVSDPMHDDNLDLGRRLAPLRALLDAIHDRLVPPDYAEVAGQVEVRGADFEVGGVRIEPRSVVSAQLLSALQGHTVRLRGFVRAGSPRAPEVLLGDCWLDPIHLSKVDGEVARGESGLVLGRAHGPFGFALPDLALEGPLAGLLERAEGRPVDLQGWSIGGKTLIVTQVVGRVTRTQLLERAAGRVRLITAGKQVEVFARVGSDQVHVRTWGWLLTRGSGVLPLADVELGGPVARGRPVWGLTTYLERRESGD